MGVINSPTFDQRLVRTKLAVQDGQTIGIAGLIRDSDSRENQGIPVIKDIPVLGTLFSNQSNLRTRTELLVMITPHVVRDQRDARALTEDLRKQLVRADSVPQALRRQPFSGSANPNRW
jgi:general secretion pathway protein D